MARAYVKYIAALLLFGLNGVVSAQLRLASLPIVFYRTLLGGLLLLLLCALRREPLHRREDPPRQVIAVVLSGVAMGLSWIFLYEAYQRVGVGLSSIAYYCGPVLVLLLTPLVFGKRLTARQLGCFSVVFGGSCWCPCRTSPRGPGRTPSGWPAASPRRCCTR